MANVPTKHPVHPDVQGLVDAGIPADRVTQVAQAAGVSHPAIAPTANPTNEGQYLADVLSDAGLPVTADNEALLATQVQEEGMPGSENNPLATTQKEAGSSGVNSAGVQQYPTLAEGAQAEAQTLKGSNMASIYKALQSGTASADQYAQALAASQYEGNNPAANAAYAQSYLQDALGPSASLSANYAQPASTALSTAAGTNLFSGVGSSTIPQLGTQATAASTNSAIANALSGLGTNAATEVANTTAAPGSPDQSPSVLAQTTVNPASTYQAQLAQLLPNIKPGVVK